MEPLAPEMIPPLSNIAPAIFVPLRDDIFTAEPPRDRIEHLKAILETIDYQRKGVKENLLYMFEREKRRIVQQAANLEQAQGPLVMKPGPAPAEMDEIIANMEAPGSLRVEDYNIQSIPGIDTSKPVPPNTPLRDKTVMELLIMAEMALKDLEGFERHIAGIQERYLASLEQEMARMDQVRRPD
ncbi:hypothetical protein C7999DRAFT_12110 [Corynascus novoguineensis]|uniref:Uncharacterized protein n=1 Tax=Corynascus novoguineensis TaxID=1126955 RepID=A0AAN7HLZ1_9PEZI|nr:hypothetical protein C7999DRAFT_12110 [Corynascus novoguineensis]